MPIKKKEIDALLAQPHIAVLAVTARDSAPLAVPTWYEYEAEKVSFHTDTSAFNYKCLQHDPRITFVVDTKKDALQKRDPEGHGDHRNQTE
jgi:nitroimidazol reductase NimA-like FMN-containing flavoprotein (pyridoxamine 5'-phosphate oxidase superfamily)